MVVLASLLVNAYLLRPTDVALGVPLGKSTISIDGTLTDWGTSASPTTGLGVSEDGSDASDSETTNSANDLNFFWAGMSTQATSGATSSSTANPIENFYFRIDTNKTSSNLSQKYNIQLNLGVADSGKADHLLQVFANEDGDTEEVELVLFQYDTPFPGIGAVTTGSLLDKVTTKSSFGGFSGVKGDTNASGAIGTTTTVEPPNMASKFGSESCGSPTLMVARSWPTDLERRRL